MSFDKERKMDQRQPAFFPLDLSCLKGNFEGETTGEHLQLPQTDYDEGDYFLAHWNNHKIKGLSFSALFQHGAVCETEELKALLSKEEVNPLEDNHPLLKFRIDAVNWILSVHCYHRFNSLTAALAMNYFDRFIRTAWLPPDKPWIAQLVAVACLSLAAKMEETDVPLLADLQVDDTEFLFESKTIKRMELMILSTLDWKMRPVTPQAFVDYIFTEWIGSRKFQCCELRKRCELLLLFVLTDHRFSHYPPSIVAAAVLETSFGSEPETRSLNVLRIDKLKLEECRKLIDHLFSDEHPHQLNKRKFAVVSREPGSPESVIDLTFYSDNESISYSPEPKRKKTFSGHPPSTAVLP